MKRSISARLLSAALAVLLIAALSAAAMATSPSTTGLCKECDAAGLVCTGLHATTTYEKVSETKHAQYFECNNGHKQLRYNTDGTFKDLSDHVASKNATCTSAAICGDCKQSFGAPLEHLPVEDKAVAATCTSTGLTAGSHCGRPGCGAVLVPQTVVEKLPHTYDDGKVVAPTCFKEGYTTFTCTVCGDKMIANKVPAMSHWYAEWTPAGNGQNSAPCKRPGCPHVKTTACVDWDFLLTPVGGDKAESYSVCPVCGETSDGTRLELVTKATTKPITGWTPEGDLVLRQGALANGERIICVSFEFDARLAQDTGKTDFTIPASILEGYQLMLLDAEGNETPLDVTVKGDMATFQLDFGTLVDGRRIPVRMLHLVPVEE